MKLIEGGWPAEATVKSTLPGASYYDAGYFQQEMREIWLKSWLLAGRVEEIAQVGDYITRDLERESIICVRGQDGAIHAYANVCRHRGSRICVEDHGHANNHMLFCPYHSWGYHIDDGALVRTPNIPDDMDGFDRRNYPLQRLKVAVWQGFIWVNFDVEAPSLEEWLGLPETFSPYYRYHLDELAVGAQKTYFVHANWKLIMENALECYHCSTIHPELSRCTPPTLPRHWIHEVVPETKVVKHAGAMDLAAGFERLGITGVPERPLFSHVTGGDAHRVFYFFIFPHVFVALASDYVFFFTLWPHQPDLTVTRGYWLFEPAVLDSPAYGIDDAVAFWDITNQQDWIASERVQKGNESRAYANGGVLIPNDWRVAKFKKYVEDALNGV
ncbi:MAG: aromatic ring-hydroxylating dioxygenase subunit alpha [Firmicutes bacterium]|nr:aromatic ring-hydroxylating dioxygenase subunit alpha [Bacillota bacterium]